MKQAGLRFVQEVQARLVSWRQIPLAGRME